MAEETTTFRGFVNPLAYFEVDEPWAPALKLAPTLEGLMEFLCTPGAGSGLDTVVSRYKEVSVEPVRLSVPPAEPEILAKLVFPLRHAKGSYALGNYLGTIALCGMVAEMLAILLYETAPLSVGDARLSKNGEKRLLGRSFEKLGQERRISVLQVMGRVSPDDAKTLHRVRAIRNKYLHYYSQTHEELASDAREAYLKTVELACMAIGQDVQDGKILLRPELVSYLLNKGLGDQAHESTGSTGGSGTAEEDDMARKALEVRQARDDWCIPAALEFVGLYSKLYSHSQADLVTHATKHGLARDTFADYKMILGGLEPTLDIAHIGSGNFDEWKTMIEREFSPTKHVVISVANPIPGNTRQTWHMRVVLEVQGSGLRVFDPAKGEDSLKWEDLRRLREQYPGGEDLLVISEKRNEPAQ